MYGYAGTILEIDLTTHKVLKRPINQQLATLFLGGAGYACAELFPLLSKDTDPLSPANKLFFMTGPLTGTMATSSGRMVVCAKSPLTGIWGESNTGSHIGIQFKKAGYDGVLIHGKADSPVYIEIADDRVEIKDASHLWGKGIFETSALLKTLEGFTRPKVLAIGPAGENLVKFAMIGSENRAFGRTGMGAVMGSKNLKAIVIQGTQKVALKQPEEFKTHTKGTNAEMMEIFTYRMLQELGTSASMDLYGVTGELPVKYYRGSTFAEANKLSGSTLAETYLKRSHHCFACPIGCGRVIAMGKNTLGVPEGEFAGPEYETLAGFGAVIMNPSLELAIKANYICNDLGIDTVSSSGLIALVMDLSERKKISTEDVDGMDMGWGNMETVFDLLEKIAYRTGFGDILADGSNALITKFSINPDQVAAIHNSHLTFHDMRSSHPMAIAYGLSPHYGGSHNSCDAYMFTTGLAIEEMDIEVNGAHESSPQVAQAMGRLMEYRAFYSSAIFCVFANPPPTALAKYLELATGENFTLDNIKELGQRIFTLKRLFNLKMGHTPQDEHIPAILLKPLPESGSEGTVPDVKLLFTEFYKHQEWDLESGKPSQTKMDRLSLADYV